MAHGRKEKRFTDADNDFSPASEKFQGIVEAAATAYAYRDEWHIRELCNKADPLPQFLALFETSYTPFGKNTYDTPSLQNAYRLLY